MTEKQFYDWQPLGGTDDVMCFVEWPGDMVVWSIARDGEAILLRAAPLENMFQEKIRAYSDAKRRQSKRLKDLADIACLVESHPDLWIRLPEEVQSEIDRLTER
jgi:hypothetical protein